MRERDIWKCAAAMYDGKWSMCAYVFIVVAAIIQLAYVFIVGARGLSLILMFSSFGISMLVVYFAAALGSLRTLFQSRHVLTLSPNASTLEAALRSRIGVSLAVMTLVAVMLGAIRFEAERASRLDLVLFPGWNSAAMLRSVIQHGQAVAYAWIGFAVFKLPVRLVGVFAFPAVFTLSTSRVSWMPITTFIAAIIGYQIWRWFSTDSADEKFKTRHRTFETIDELEPASKTWFRRWLAARRDARLARIQSDRSASRLSDVLALVPTNLSGANHAVFYGLGLGFGILAFRNQLDTGFFAITGMFFIATFATFFVVTPLQPYLLLPVNLSRNRIAPMLFGNWTTRALQIWICAGTFAFVWVTLAHYTGIWIPFGIKGKLPWVEADEMLSFPGANVLVIACVAIGLSVTTHWVFAASPFFMCGRRRYGYVRMTMTFVLAGSCIATEFALQSWATSEPLSTSYSLRLLFVACAFLPALAFLYYTAMKRTWHNANLAEISAAVRAYQIEMQQLPNGANAMPTRPQ